MEDEKRELYEKSDDPHACKVIMDYVEILLQQENIQMTDVQKLALMSHVSAMVYRSKHKETIPAVDPSIFHEVSSESIAMASEVCHRLPGLNEDEKYLLSIHFESAKI